MKKFYLGMDIGTESVGMACTDENYNLLRAKGKDLWAVRLFDEAKDASERRVKRTARRRLARRRQRIEFLQGIFAPFMEDELFFIRLNNSGFYEEDKDERLNGHFSLFNAKGYTDIDFYNEYPTIFHLRQKLCRGERADLRHYYLVLHHIIKYRGHFLFEGEDVNGIRDIKKLFESYNNAVEELEAGDLYLLIEKAEEFRALAMERRGLNDKKKAVVKLFDTNSPQLKEMLALLIGAKAKMAVIFGEEYAEKYKDEKISFKEIDDDAFEQKSEVFEEEQFAILKSAREIYNFIVLEKILEGKGTISEAMVALYDKHAEDLKLLKKLVKQNYSKETYYKIFRSLKESANYVNYVGYNKNKGKKVNAGTKCKKDDFYAFLKKNLTEIQGEGAEILNYVKAEIENGTFLPKILNADNGLFPHQINGMELDLILQNLAKNYPEFTVKDDFGFTACEKIKKIFLFKIPYYVGPLNTAHENSGSGNSWMRRKEGKTERITPWNFDEIVDKGASNEQFIRRMTNKCTYLHNQDVLPKGSMYYQAFNTLNQINKITLNAVPIWVELKQELFRNLFLTHKKVGEKQIKEYLVITGKCTLSEAKELSIGGFDTEIGLNVTMSSYKLFADKFGAMVDENPEIFEDIILWHTLNTDKGIVEDLIKQKYGTIPQIKENIKWLKGLTSFKEFGRLSKKLLDGIIGGIDPATGEAYTVLNRLYNTNYNFMQIMEVYEFAKAVEEENSGLKEEITYDDVASLYVSPMVRRGIWQSLIMADEYVKAVGKAPDKIFIEVTRRDEEKKRTVSRKNSLLALYDQIGEDCANIDELVKELNCDEITDSKLRQERLYLYFLQLGRCAYTGERIELNQLATDLYDVDHIVPQSITKDDSIDNKVLVKRVKNAQKTDIYPLPLGFTNQQSFWKLLKIKGLMSENKYAKLTRVEPLTENDFREFTNRQLVVTNQTVKAVAELLKAKYGALGTKIVYSKAIHVDEFKQKNEIVKCRETNDLHHARDAYLNVVVGNVYDTKFTSAMDYYYRKADDSWREYNLKTLFYRPIEGAWAGSEDINRIKKIVAKTSMSVTRYAITNHGAFYNETVYKKDDNATYPRKGKAPYDQTEKYGGFKSPSTAYFAIVKSKDKKGNVIKTIEAIPVMVDYAVKNNQKAIIEYLHGIGLNEPEIVVPKIKIKALVSTNGYKVWLAGMTGNRILIHNAQQWFTNSNIDLYVKQLVKLIERDRAGRLSNLEKEQEQIPLKSNRFKDNLYATKESNLQLYDLIIQTLNKNVYQGLSSVKSFALKISEKRDLFISLTTFNQIKVLLQIIRFMKCNAECADLTLLEDGATCGKLRIGKNITDVDFAIIHQSACGLTERVQKI